MKYLATVTELRSYSIEIEADDTGEANDIILSRIDNGIRPTDGCKERVVVEFDKKNKGWKQI